MGKIKFNIGAVSKTKYSTFFALSFVNKPGSFTDVLHFYKKNKNNAAVFQLRNQITSELFHQGQGVEKFTCNIDKEFTSTDSVASVDVLNKSERFVYVISVDGINKTDISVTLANTRDYVAAEDNVPTFNKRSNGKLSSNAKVRLNQSSYVYMYTVAFTDKQTIETIFDAMANPALESAVVKSTKIEQANRDEQIDIDFVIDSSSVTLIPSEKLNHTYVYTIVSNNPTISNRFVNYLYDVEENLITSIAPKAVLTGSVQADTTDTYKIDEATVYSNSRSVNKVFVMMLKGVTEVDENQVLSFVRNSLPSAFVGLDENANHDGVVDETFYYFNTLNADKSLFQSIGPLFLRNAFTDLADASKREPLNTVQHTYLPVIVALDDNAHSVFVQEPVRNYVETSVDSNWSATELQENTVADSTGFQATNDWGVGITSADGEYLVVSGEGSSGGQVVVYKQQADIGGYQVVSDLSLSGLGADMAYAKSVDISHDGSFVVVSGHVSSTNTGTVNVYKRGNTGEFTLYQTIQKVDMVGDICKLSPDGDFLAVSSGVNKQVHVFRNKNNSFEDFQTLNKNVDGFGKSCGLTANAAVMIVGSDTNKAYQYFMNADKTAFTEATNLSISANDVKVSSNGEFALVSGDNGTVHSYKRDVVTGEFVFHQDISKTNVANYGSQISMSADGKYALVGGSTDTYMYKLDNNTEVFEETKVLQNVGDVATLSADGSRVYVSTKAKPAKCSARTCTPRSSRPSQGHTASAATTKSFCWAALSV